MRQLILDELAKEQWTDLRVHVDSFEITVIGDKKPVLMKGQRAYIEISLALSDELWEEFGPSGS